MPLAFTPSIPSTGEFMHLQWTSWLSLAVLCMYVWNVMTVGRLRMKLGVKAPKEVKVFRGEIHAEIQKENRAASESHLPPDLDNFIRKK